MMPIRSLRYLLPALLLSACTSMPLSSMMALNQIDFTSTQLADLRVAVELPAAIHPASEGVVLDVVFKSGAAEEKMAFHMVPVTDPKELTGPLPVPRPGRMTHAFLLDETDQQLLDAKRRGILGQKNRSRNVSIAMGVATREFCRDGALPEGPVLVSTLIATTETKGYVAVVNNFDLRSDATIGASLSSLPDCGSKG